MPEAEAPQDAAGVIILAAINFCNNKDIVVVHDVRVMMMETS